MKRILHANDRLLILNGDAELQQAISQILPLARTLSATNYEMALNLLLTHRISVVIGNIEGDYSTALAFFSRLKQQYPATVSIILADKADSGAIIDLINQARVYRYMFRPLKIRLMARYLEAALQQYRDLSSIVISAERQSTEAIKPVVSARFVGSVLSAVDTSEVVSAPPRCQLRTKSMRRLFRRFILQQDYS